MKVLKPFTIKGKLYQLMIEAKKTKSDVAIDENSLAKKPGSRVTNSSLSAHIAELTKEYFPGHRFCYHTKNGQRFILMLVEADYKKPATNGGTGVARPSIPAGNEIPVGDEYDRMMSQTIPGR